MLLKIGQQPDHGFDEPLGLLSDCHRRIEHFLAVLVAMANRANGGTLDAAQRVQLEGAVAYFATAAPRHTADEERSLFPRLQASRDPAALHAVDLVRRLERDHAEAGEHHEAVDRLARQWLADGSPAEAGVAALRERLARLHAIYESHIAVEDRELFPAASRVLSAQEIEAIGREMAERRRPAR